MLDYEDPFPPIVLLREQEDGSFEPSRELDDEAEYRYQLQFRQGRPMTRDQLELISPHIHIDGPWTVAAMRAALAEVRKIRASTEES